MRFGTKLYRKIVGIPMKRDFMASLTYNKEIIQAFNSKSRYLDDLVNIDSPSLNLWRYGGPNLSTWTTVKKAIASYTEARFFDLHLYFSNRFVSSKIYDKHGDFGFDIVNFPFLWMGTFLVLPLTVFTFLNLFHLLECLVMWLTSMLVIKF